jgi:Family of unknown function (DUF6252)
MTSHRRVALATLVLGVGLGCGGGAGGPGGPGGGDAGSGGGGSGNITANVDGQAWQSTVTSEQAQVGPLGAITIQGTYANTTTITLNLYNIDQPGTYPLGVGAAVVGGLGVVSTVSGQSWATPSSGAAGSVTLTTLTSTRIAGTFTFEATPLAGGAAGNKAVTNGNFDLILASNGHFGTLPDNQGSVVRGSVAGAPWNAATAFMTLPGGTLSLSFGNLGYTIGVLKTSFTGPGTFDVGLSPGLAAVSAVVPSTGGGPSWVPAASGSGTFTVTSLTATRIQGTLTATLVPLAGSGAVGNLDISNLAIDIGRN